MTETMRGPADAAGAGAIVVASTVVFMLAGLGLGALVGAPTPLALAGGGVGLVAGFWLVYSRFGDI